MIGSGLRIERRPLQHLSPSEISQWECLLRANADNRWAFLSPAYAQCVDRTISPVDVVMCWTGNNLIGVMALQRTSQWLGRLGIWEPAGGSMTDYFGLVSRPDVRIDWTSLLEGAGLPCLYFTHLCQQQSSIGLAGDSPRKGLRTRVHPDGGAAHWAWLKVQDKKLVNDTDRRERKLETEHGALRFAVASTDPKTDLAELIELKNAQYARTGHQRGPLFAPRNVALLQRLLLVQCDDCMPRLSTLHVGEQLVAAHFGLQCGPVLHYWFPVYAPAFAAYSPGRILFKHILLSSQTLGIECIDRGEGDTPAKRDFATEEHLFYKGLVYAGIYGKAVALAKRVQWRLRATSVS